MARKKKSFIGPDCKSEKTFHRYCVWKIGGQWCECNCHPDRKVEDNQ